MQATTNGKVTCEKGATRRGFANVPCIKCGEHGVQAYLNDLGTFYCPDCDEEFTANDVRDLMAAWAKVLKWIELAPELPE